MSEKRLDSSTSTVKTIHPPCISTVERTDVTPITWQRIVYNSILQNFDVVWLDPNSSIGEPQRVGNNIHIFHNMDDCADFLTDIEDRQVLMIISTTLSQYPISLIHDISQLHSIYMLSQNTKPDEQLLVELPKVMSISTEILPTFNWIKTIARRSDPNPASVNFLSHDDLSTSNLNQLEQPFMYSQLLKEILLEIDFDTDKSVKHMFSWYHNECLNNPNSPRLSDKFEKGYHTQTPIQWYIQDSFVYRVLNEALRTQKIDTLLWMGFFLRALHENIQQLHSDQMNNHQMKPFIVYRGLSLTKTDFEKMTKANGGLMSFNEFLSTSTDLAVAEFFADANLNGPDVIPIIYEMTIDPSIPSTLFADLNNISAFKGEKEILFSMHTIFRIIDIQNDNNDTRFWRVKLTLVSNTDNELIAVTNKIREETQGGSTGLFRLCKFLISYGEYDKAKEIYNAILGLIPDDDNLKLHIYGQLAMINEYQGKYLDALELYEKTCEVFERLGFTDHSTTATLYNNIGRLYDAIGKYSEALLHYEKALHFEQEESFPDEFKLAMIYNNIGVTHENMKNGSEALENCQKSLQISQKILPSYHPQLAGFYISTGLAANMIRKYSIALSYYEKALEIYKRTLPQNHRHFNPLYNNMGGVYFDMCQYSNALLYHEKALEICQISYPPNHPYLARSYSNIGLIHNAMGEYSKALLSHKMALEIRQNALPSNHLSLLHSYNDVGITYRLNGNYSEALICHEKALEIGLKGLPPNDTFIADCYMDIGDVYIAMGHSSKAISFYEKALEIRQNILPKDHPDLGLSYNNLASVYYHMKDYPKALSLFTQAFEIYEKALPPDHPHLTQYYNNVGILHKEAEGDDATALFYLRKALESRQRTLPSNHPELANSYDRIGVLYASIGDHSKALLHHKKALEIREIILPPNHSNLADLCNRIGVIYGSIGNHPMALSFFQRAVHIGQQSLTLEDSRLQIYQENLKILQKLVNNPS